MPFRKNVRPESRLTSRSAVELGSWEPAAARGRAAPAISVRCFSEPLRLRWRAAPRVSAVVRQRVR